jgi:hypothetical protein
MHVNDHVCVDVHVDVVVYVLVDEPLKTGKISAIVVRALSKLSLPFADRLTCIKISQNTTH